MTDDTIRTEAPARWRLLLYLDGPRVGATAVLGFLTGDELPSVLPGPYVLDGDGYRFGGEEGHHGATRQSQVLIRRANDRGEGAVRVEATVRETFFPDDNSEQEPPWFVGDDPAEDGP